MKFCEKIQMHRKRLGLSQEELADRLGVSRQAVSKWEVGSFIPERLLQVAVRFDAYHSGKQITIFNFLFFIFASILPFIFSTRVFAIARPRPVDFLAVSTV